MKEYYEVKTLELKKDNQTMVETGDFVDHHHFLIASFYQKKK